MLGPEGNYYIEREKSPNRRAKEAISGEISIVDPVVVKRNCLNGDVLWDIKRKVDYLVGKGGVILLHGTTRSGKSSLLRTFQAENPNNCAYLDGRRLTTGSPIEAANDLISKRGKQRTDIVLIDETDILESEATGPLVSNLLKQSRVVLATLHFTFEDRTQAYQAVAQKARVPFYTVRTVSKDTPGGLAQRIANWFTELKLASIKRRPNLVSAIESVKFTEDACAAIGQITNFRPYEVNALIEELLINSPDNQVHFTAESVHDLFNQYCTAFIEYNRKNLESFPMIASWHEDLVVRISKHEKEAMSVLKRILREETIDKGYGEKALWKLMEYTGLDFISSDGNGFSLKGDWLQRDWKFVFGY